MLMLENKSETTIVSWTRRRRYLLRWIMLSALIAPTVNAQQAQARAHHETLQNYSDLQPRAPSWVAAALVEVERHFPPRPVPVAIAVLGAAAGPAVPVPMAVRAPNLAQANTAARALHALNRFQGYLDQKAETESIARTASQSKMKRKWHKLKNVAEFIPKQLVGRAIGVTHTKPSGKYPCVDGSCYDEPEQWLFHETSQQIRASAKITNEKIDQKINDLMGAGNFIAQARAASNDIRNLNRAGAAAHLVDGSPLHTLRTVVDEARQDAAVVHNTLDGLSQPGALVAAPAAGSPLGRLQDAIARANATLTNVAALNLPQPDEVATLTQTVNQLSQKVDSKPSKDALKKIIKDENVTMNDKLDELEKKLKALKSKSCDWMSSDMWNLIIVCLLGFIILICIAGFIWVAISSRTQKRGRGRRRMRMP